MIRLYTEFDHYESNQRKYLFDILRPYIPVNKLDSYGITKQNIEFVNSLEESQICLLPMAWNYYVNNNCIEKAKKLIKDANSSEKKILIWTAGDYHLTLPNYNNIIRLSASVYFSNQNFFTIPLPIVINDPLRFLSMDRIMLKKLSIKPIVGFCGQSDKNIIISLMKMIRLIKNNFKYKLNLSALYSGSIIPPTYKRKLILDIIEKSPIVKSNFIRRSRYLGGEYSDKKKIEIIRKEFYDNIISSDYTICIRGTGNFSARFYETLALGRIPVFINTDCRLPFDNVINWKKHLIWIEEDEIYNLEEKINDYHQSLTIEKYYDIQKKNRKIWNKYFRFSGFFNEFPLYLQKLIS